MQTENAQNIPTATAVIPQQSIPPKKSNSLKYLIIVLFILLGFAGAYYSGMKGYKISIQTPPSGNIIPTNAAVQNPTPTGIVVNPEIPSKNEVNQKDGISGNEAGANAGEANNQAGACTLQAGAKSNLFNSPINKICFLTAKQGAAAVPPVMIKVNETGSKIFVYPQNMQQSSGQFVTVFQKEADETLEEAIKEDMLAGININDCFVKILPNGNYPANFVKASIAYPVPENAQEPAWEFGQNCPTQYKQSNGIRYFLMDKNHPDRFFFFSIGQYGIEAETGNSDKFWQDTIQVY